MSVVLRVAERFKLASRVAARARRADSIGDPKELFERFKQAVAKYAEKEPQAQKYVAAYAEVVRLMAQGAPAEQLKAVRENGMNEPIGDQSGKSRTHRELSYDITTHAAQHGFGKVRRIAQDLCWAILQQLVLLPKVRKSVEAAAKFYDRDPRMNPKGKTYEESLAKRVQLYLDFLEDFRKHEKLFGLAIQQGKGHATDETSTTRLKAGPFVVVNTGGFNMDTMTTAAKLVEEAAQKMEGIGLGKVCYGDVLVSNRLSGKTTVAAFYVVAKDEMFVRADVKVALDTVRIVCHELTHRLEHKFLLGREREITQLYAKINTHSGFLSQTEMPEFGAAVTYKSELWKVVDKDTRRRSVVIGPANPLRCFVCAEKGRPTHVPDEEHKFPIARKETITMPAERFYELLGKKQAVDPLDFITHYAKKGGPSENFAEMTSFYAIGKLPKEQVDLLLPLL